MCSPAHPVIPILTKFSMLGGLPHIFLKLEFQNDRSITFGAAGIKICLLPLTRLIVSTTAYCYHRTAQSVIGSTYWDLLVPKYVKYLPLHVFPSPSNPLLHLHDGPSLVFLHVAFWEQPPLSTSHDARTAGTSTSMYSTQSTLTDI